MEPNQCTNATKQQQQKQIDSFEKAFGHLLRWRRRKRGKNKAPKKKVQRKRWVNTDMRKKVSKRRTMGKKSC